MSIESKIAKLRKYKKQIEDEKMWDECMVALLEGVDDKDKKLMETILQQQWKYLQQCDEHADSGSHGYNGYVSRIIVPAVRRIYADFPLRNLVGIQPMQKQVDKVYTLDYSYEDCKVENGLEGFSSAKRLKLEVIANNIEAGSRKTQGAWHPPKPQDLTHCYGLDYESEQTQMLAQDIRAELMNEVLQDLKQLAGNPEVVKLENESAASRSDDILKLACRVRANCSKIAQMTRRGAGNWIVVSPAMARILSEEQTAKIEIKDDYEAALSELLEVGTLSDTIRVFVTDVPDDEIIIGYKGVSDTDTGYIYSPYIGLMSGGEVLHPTTLEPVIKFMTRYGKFVTNNADRYYRTIKVESDLLIKKE